MPFVVIRRLGDPAQQQYRPSTSSFIASFGLQEQVNSVLRLILDGLHRRKDVKFFTHLCSDPKSVLLFRIHIHIQCSQKARKCVFRRVTRPTAAYSGSSTRFTEMFPTAEVNPSKGGDVINCIGCLVNGAFRRQSLPTTSGGV